MHIWCQSNTHTGKNLIFYNNLSILNKIKKMGAFIAHSDLSKNLQFMKVLGF